MTSSYVDGNFQTSFENAYTIANGLLIRNYKILRVKIEAMLSNEGIPELGILYFF